MGMGPESNARIRPLRYSRGAQLKKKIEKNRERLFKRIITILANYDCLRGNNNLNSRANKVVYADSSLPYSLTINQKNQESDARGRVIPVYGNWLTGRSYGRHNHNQSAPP